MPDPTVSIAPAPPQVSRSAAYEQEDAERRSRPPVGTLTDGDVPNSVHDVLRSHGQGLDAATLFYFEQRFGHDFSNVRVHSGGRAETSASAIGALAYTSGGHVVFGAGQYAPHTQPGRRLLAHELAHVVQQQAAAPRSAAAAVQREPVDKAKPTQPTLIISREGPTDRIDDAYGKGTLDEKRWRELLATAVGEFKDGKVDNAARDYLVLYADLAKLAQAGRVVRSTDAINVVHGSKYTCNDARPGLNFSLSDRNQWGANATTAFVDESGKFGVRLKGRGELQPEVAIVLSRDAFRPEKEQSLGILRHEMIHAGHDADDAAAFARADPKARTGPKPTSDANTELLGYVEGFMTIFQLTEPAPTDVTHPAFVELLGALDTGGDVLPWSEADASTRSNALGQLQEYYCHALDGPHRESFSGWVQIKSAEVRLDQLATGEPSPDTFSPGGVDDRTLEILQNKRVDRMGAMLRLRNASADFFHGLRGIIANKCKGLTPTTKMK